MGGIFGGGNTVNKTESYTPNPLTQQLATGTSEMLGTAMAQPYSNMPVQPIAGFSPDQERAFQANRDVQGAAQPYFDAAKNYIAQGSSPLDMGEVGRLYGQLSDPVFANLENIFGQQRAKNTSDAINRAGGSRADRIGVAEGELAKQQGLAAGQTGTGLLQSAIQSYLNQKQLQQAGGSLMGNLGLANQGANYQDIASLYNMGSQQQQLEQAIKNASYQHAVGQFQYPSWLAQLGSGITGSLAGALGGTKSGTTTYPPQSPFGQIAGLGVAGLGAWGESQKGKGGSSKPTGGGSEPTGGNGGGADNEAFGGRVYADGGGAFSSNDPRYGDSFWSDMDNVPGKGGASASGPGGKGSGIGSLSNLASLGSKAWPGISEIGGKIGGGLGSLGTSIGDYLSSFLPEGVSAALPELAMMAVASGGAVNAGDTAQGFQYGGMPMGMPDRAMPSLPGQSPWPTGTSPLTANMMQFPWGAMQTPSPPMTDGSLPPPAQGMLQGWQPQPQPQPAPPLPPMQMPWQVMGAPPQGGQPAAPVAHGGSSAGGGSGKGGTFGGVPSNINTGVPASGNGAGYAKAGRVVSAADDVSPDDIDDPDSPYNLGLRPSRGTLEGNLSDMDVRTPNGFFPRIERPAGSLPPGLPAVMTTDTEDAPSLPKGVSHYAPSGEDKPSPSPSPSPEASLPAVPEFGKMSARPSAISDPLSTFLLHAGMKMMAGSGRDAHGLPLGGGPLGQFLHAAGSGGESGLNALIQARQQEREDVKMDNAAKQHLFEAQSKLLPYKMETVSGKRQHDISAEVQMENARHHGVLEEQGNFVFYPGTKLNEKTGQEESGIWSMDKKTNTQTFTPNGSFQSPSLGPIAIPGGTGSNGTTPSPVIKGFDPPLPAAVGGMSGESIALQGTNYALTGRVPTGMSSSRNPAIMARRDAVINYGAALLESRGISRDEAADMWLYRPRHAAWLMGADGRAAGALGTLVDHLDTARDLMKALHNPTGNPQLFNTIKNKFEAQFGKPAPTNVELASQIIGAEVMKAIGVAGAGGEAERKAASAVADMAKSPAQAEGGINTVQRLAAGQLRTKQRQAEAIGLPEERLKKLVGPRAWEVLGSLEGGTQGAATTKPTELSPRVTVVAPTRVEDVAVGETIMQDGKKYRKQPDGSMEEVTP